MAVGVASGERSKDYGVGVCVVCGRSFGRRSGNSLTCGDPACRRARKTQLARRYEANRRVQRKLRPHEQALRDTALQVALDQARQVGYNQAEARWLALVDCRRSLADEDAWVALRQVWIDLAAIAIRGASELPAPTAEARFDPGAKAQATRLVAAANGAA